jgi:hypothetical protein
MEFILLLRWIALASVPIPADSNILRSSLQNEIGVDVPYSILTLLSHRAIHD